MSNRIAELRNEKGLTLKQLGDILNIRDNTLSQYETGKRFPRDKEVWNKLAKFFDVSVEYVMGLSSNRIDNQIIEKKIKDHFINLNNFTSSELQSKALIYWNNNSSNEDYTLLTNAFLSKLYFSNETELLNKLNHINSYNTFFIEYITEYYLKRVHTNENYINYHLNHLNLDLDIFENYIIVNDDKVSFYKADDVTNIRNIIGNEYTELGASCSTFSTQLNLNLVDEIEKIKKECYDKISALKDKYPNEDIKTFYKTELLSDNKNKLLFWLNYGTYNLINDFKLNNNEQNKLYTEIVNLFINSKR